MHRLVLKIVLVALAVGANASVALQARAAAPDASAAATAAPAASSARSKALMRKQPRLRKPRPVVAPGVTGGTPEASARDPGGPPPGTPNGVTIPIPSVKK